MDRSQVHAEGRLEVRGLELEVKMEAGGSSLNVEVQDPYSGDCWRADFQPSYIEDLTHKTGNFKQFSVFCSMLESAITQSSESVSLDLLTYADLERLRSRKSGPAMRSALHPSTAATTTTSGAANPALNSKRYLILIYTVEFDRIHYPLALGYAGRPDTATLQRAVRQLKEELSHLRGHPGVVQDHKHRELESLQRDKRELEALVARLQKRAEGGGCGGAGDAGVVVGATAAKELRVLRRLVSSLQEELGRERAKAQRSAAKRSQEIRKLNDELEETRASERSLRARVKCLSTELALYKRGRVTPVLPLAERSRGSERASSGGPGRARGEVRSASRERERTASREGRPPVRGPRSRTPSLSPAGRVPAFDPTAYVRQREQRKKEAELRGSRQRRRELQGTPGSGGSSGGRGRPRSRPPSGGRALNGHNTRSSSLESAHSRRSSAGSGSDAAPFAEPLTSATTHRRGGKPVKKSSWESPAEPKRGRAERRRQLASTPTATQPAETMPYYSQSADLSEIDARLDALQDYMRALEAHK